MSYEVLLELARITPSQLVPGLLSDTGEISKLYVLYQCLLAGYDEADTLHELYGGGVTPQTSKYRMLKSRLKRSLLNALHIQGELSWDYRSYDIAYVTGLEQLSLARALIAKRAYKTAGDVALTAFHKCRPYEIPDVCEGLTGILAGLYLGVLRDPKAYRSFEKLHTHYLQCYYDANVVMERYRAWKDESYKRKLNPAELGQLAVSTAEDLGEYWDKYPEVSRIQMSIGTMRVNGLRLMGRFEEAIKAVESLEERLEKCGGISVLSRHGLILDKVYCSIGLRDFELGKAVIEASKSKIDEGSINWLKLAELTVLLGLQTGEYDYARTAYEQNIAMVMRLLPNDRTKDVWRLYRVYIDFGSMLEEQGGLAGERIGLRTVSADFLNKVPSFTSAKRSFNIQAIVAQAVYFLLSNEHETFVTRTDALAKYCSRYLKDNDELRHNCFFKLLIEVEKSGFQLKLRRRRIITILERMTSPVAQEIGRRTNTEIIPYEVLWNLIIEHLGCSDERLRA